MRISPSMFENDWEKVEIRPPKIKAPVIVVTVGRFEVGKAASLVLSQLIS
jgi:hypothetical protein